MESLFDSAAFNSSLFYPSPRVSRPPRGSRDLRVEVASGVRLHVRLHECLGTKAAVLLFHGNGETVSDYDSLAEQYARVGADLAVVDYRGYGASEGVPTLRDCLADAAPALRAVHEALGRAVVVMGRSLGSACAAELCQRARPEVAGYIFESGIADLHGLIRRRGIVVEAALPERDLEAFCHLRKLRRCTTVSLVMHGADDELIPAAEARAAYDALAATDKWLELIPRAGHNDLSDHPQYWDTMRRFVTNVAAPRG